jgi:NAD(P)-dependent dehydrogenase (short-subunit alcohol dehydrogenase family)
MNKNMNQSAYIESENAAHETPGQYSNPLTAILKGIGDLMKRKKSSLVLKGSDRVDGKTILITGASSGLGYAAARQLAERGATVIMACRSGIPQRGQEISVATGSKHVYMEQVDLSDLNSILKLAEKIKEKYAPIDVLICNAAIVPSKSRRTAQGLEEMFVVNYLAKYLFIRLLAQNGTLRASGSGHDKPRIIIVSSESHRNPADFDWENFGRYKEYGMSKTVEYYGYYKLLLTTFAMELSRRLNNSSKINAAVFALCPGPVNTNIAREAPGWAQPLLSIVFRIFFKSPEKAAEPIIYLAASEAVQVKPFVYLFLMNRKEIDRKASAKANGKKLWELTEEIIGKKGIALMPLPM